MRLSELKTGERAVIVKVNGHGSFRKRIIEMGFVKGKHVKVILNAPLKDPIEYEIIGYKISLTSKETQDLFKTNEPLYGAQIPSHILASPAHVKLAEMNEPLIEVELAMTAKEDLHEGLSDRELLDRVTVAGDIEVPDARFGSWFPSLNKFLVVADCAVGGYIVKGTPVDGTTLTLEDLTKIHVDLVLDGEKVREGDSTEVLGNPINALRWLVSALAKRGKTLKKGTVVSTGTFFVPPKLAAGTYEARFTGALTQTVKLNVEA